LLLLLLYIYVILVKLFFVKDYKNYPPFVPSFGKIKKLEFIKISKQLEESKKSLTVLDPGCGTADLIIKLAKKFPKHKFVGIEWNKSLYNIAKLKSKNLPNFTVLNQNMFDCSFCNADIIVCFLITELMEKIGNKIKKEGKKGLMVYSNTFSIPNLELQEKITTRKIFLFSDLYIYKL
jgi:SAM-dependent methyltransferase